MLILPDVLLISLLAAAGYGLLFILYTTFPQAFMFIYHWKRKHVGYAYFAAAIGNTLGLIAASVVGEHIIRRRAAKGDTRPENRLIPMIAFGPVSA